MRHRTCCALTLLLVAVIAACDGVGPNGSQRTLLVEHHMAECVGETIGLCLLVREPDDPAFGYRHAPIDDFTYEWGVSYEIQVVQQSVPDPVTAAPSIRTVLDSIVARQPVAPGTAFDLFLTAGANRIERVADDRFQFYGEREFSCSAPDCDEVAAAIASGARIRFSFSHPAGATEPLTLDSLRVCDRALVGSTLCEA